jgi:hypothetical protein
MPFQLRRKDGELLPSISHALMHAVQRCKPVILIAKAKFTTHHLSLQLLDFLMFLAIHPLPSLRTMPLRLLQERKSSTVLRPHHAPPSLHLARADSAAAI